MSPLQIASFCSQSSQGAPGLEGNLRHAVSWHAVYRVAPRNPRQLSPWRVGHDLRRVGVGWLDRQQGLRDRPPHTASPPSLPPPQSLGPEEYERQKEAVADELCARLEAVFPGLQAGTTFREVRDVQGKGGGQRVSPVRTLVLYQAHAC